MTDFLATLALRGAGLPPADGRAALAPRPRALFEPDHGGDLGDATVLERADDIPAPAAPPVSRLVVPDRLVAPAERPASTAFDPPPHDGTRPSQPHPAAVAAAANRPTTAAPPQDGTPPRTVVQPAASTIPARTVAQAPPPASVPSPTPLHPPPTERATTPIAAAQPESDGRDPSTAAVAPRLPAMPLRSATPGTVRLPAVPEAPPSVTVSIGRIDVEVAAPPPRPPVPIQRAAPERTRGFERYAHARRGRPRA